MRKIELDIDDQQQFEAFRDEVRELAEDAPQKIQELQAELREVLAPFDAFDVVANVWMVNTPVDPNNYRESDQAGLMSVVDYVGLICAERPSRDPANDHEPQSLMDAGVLDKVDELVKSIFDLTNLHLAHRSREAGSAFEELRGRLVARRMFVQGPGFEFQLRELLTTLFGSERIQAALLETMGFTADDALRICDAMLEVSLRKFSERSRDGHHLHAAIENALQTGELDLLDGLGLPVRALLAMAESDRKRAIRDIGRSFTFSGLGTTMQVTAAGVVSESGIALERVKAFFNAFSVGFGQTQKLLLGTDVLRGRERPVMADDAGNYLLVSHLALLWALRPALEASLKTGNAWHAFETGRAKHVEEAALDHFRRAMPGSEAYRSVSFEIEEGETKKRHEIDGLLICDTVMLVIESKSGSLSASGQRGAPARLEKHLRELLVKAAEQAEHASRALRQRDCKFIAEDGREVKLPPQVSEIFPIVVTLEDLSEITTVIWELEAAGLLPSEVPTPWALSLFELELISDLTEYAAMLIHFLRRRARLNVLKRVRASDELDWWVHYLDFGLYFEREFEGSDAPDVISLASMTDPVDAYYLWKRGDRTKPAPKPRQKLKRDLRALLDTLRDQGRSGYLEASIALLDLDDRGRQELTRGFRRLREMTKEDGEFHNLSMLVGRDDSLGITFMASPNPDIGRLEERLGPFTAAKKHQTRLRRWVSFGWSAGTPHLLDLVVLMIGDWHPDLELDALLGEMGLDPSEPAEPSDREPFLQLPKTARRPPSKR